MLLDNLLVAKLFGAQDRRDDGGRESTVKFYDRTSVKLLFVITLIDGYKVVGERR